MPYPQTEPRTRPPASELLLPYIANLELEVDRLRKQGSFVLYEVRSALKQIGALCDSAEAPRDAPRFLDEIGRSVRELAAALHDLQDPPGYHPAHDQVIAIAVRPLIDKIFRWQQRLADVPQVQLCLQLEAEHVEWFPARLRHILENLIAHALKCYDSEQTESSIHLALQVAPQGYQFRVSDQGARRPAAEQAGLFELFYRSAPARAAGLGLGLAVVKLLVEQSGGTLSMDSGEGQGAIIVATLPRYDVDDFLI